MELLQGVLLLTESHVAALCNDLNGGSEVLELSALSEIGDVDLDFRRGYHIE